MPKLSNTLYLGIGMELYRCSLGQYVSENELSEHFVNNLAQDMIRGVTQLHSVNIIHGDIAKRNYGVLFGEIYVRILPTQDIPSSLPNAV